MVRVDLTNGPVVQCAANFSEGRRPAVIAAILASASQEPDAVVADHSADADHNRMVLSLLGQPDGVLRAVLAAAAVAIAGIDLRAHDGVHPRLGAIDVIPFVPIRGVSMAECVDLSVRCATALSERHRLPVYLYEASARPGRVSDLPALRRGGFEALCAADLAGARAPDFGPDHAHPTAGGAVCGARGPLVAVNANLEQRDLGAARRIAAALRRRRDAERALCGVRAIGLMLERAGMAQVSMNLTQPGATPLPGVLKAVREEADEAAVNVEMVEIIGLVPRASFAGRSPFDLLCRHLADRQIIDNWLDGGSE